jgi:hypothetical protein
MAKKLLNDDFCPSCRNRWPNWKVPMNIRLNKTSGRNGERGEHRGNGATPDRGRGHLDDGGYRASLETVA